MDVREIWRRHSDVLVAGAVAVLYTVELLRWAPADKAVAVPLALLACAMLTLRRRLPVLAFVLTMVANYGVLVFAPKFDSSSISFVVVFLIALYSLGRYARGLEAWLGVLCVVAEIVVFVVGDGGHSASDIFFAMAFVGAPYAAGLTVRLRQEREAVLTASNEQLRQEQEENARRAVAAERARIARELHDVVSHAISVTVLQARGGRKLVGTDDAAVRQALDAIEQTNTSALGDMRRLLAVLRDTDTDSGSESGPEGRQAPQPSLASLESLVEQVRRSGLPVDVEVTGRPGVVPPGVDLSAFRIIQEALTNVLKHGGPTARAQVCVTYADDELSVAVIDTGTPQPVHVDGHGGHGLIGIRERVAVVGGTVETGPGQQGGYVVRARLPYSVEA